MPLNPLMFEGPGELTDALIEEGRKKGWIPLPRNVAHSAIEEVLEHHDPDLSHHGVKGMKWGVRRRAIGTPQEVVVSDRRKSVKTSGGQGHPAHPDSVRARTIGQKGKASGLKALSDKELQDYAKRLQLEQNVKRLNYNDQSPPKKVVLTILGQTGKQTVQNAANDAGAQAVKKGLKIALAAAA